MTADIERGMLFGEAHCIVERSAIGHEGRGREDAVDMRFNDALIYVARKSEIVRINCQRPHALEEAQLDAQKFLRIRPEILDQPVSLTGHGVEVFEQGGVV